MDITPQDTTNQPMNDDQELAKALAGVLPGSSAPIAPPALPADDPVAPSEPPVTDEPAPTPPPVTPEVPEDPVVEPAPSVSETPSTSDTGGLEDIKKDALGQLRPLIDKVDLPAEEKFDTYLMLIRSTDDSSLIKPAHQAAQAISDEKRKAEALLDIIKEIDYLSRNNQPTV